MAWSNSWSHMKVLLVTLLSLGTILSITSAAYTGLRYGKREPAESIGRLFPRSGGERNIQSRSAGTRFYPGTRFGGKRAYWQPVPMVSEFVENSDLPPSNLPYDCVHVPFFGLRCTRVHGETYWNGNNNDEDGMVTNEAFESDGSGNPSGLAAASSGNGGP